MNLLLNFSSVGKCKPICNCVLNSVLCNCLVDTGAEVPVLCNSSLLSIFKNYTYIGKYKVGGFGKFESFEEVYKIDNLVFGDAHGNCLTFRNLVVYVISKPSLGCSFILSSSMLTECKLTIDYGQRLIDIQSPKTLYNFDVSPDGVPYVCSSS